jgi:hypothetical protein
MAFLKYDVRKEWSCLAAAAALSRKRIWPREMGKMLSLRDSH